MSRNQQADRYHRGQRRGPVRGRGSQGRGHDAPHGGHGGQGGGPVRGRASQGSGHYAPFGGQGGGGGGHFLQGYIEMPGRGTCPLFSGRIFKSEKEGHCKEDETTGLQIRIYSCNEDKEHYLSSFEQYTRKNRSSLWFSRDLAIVLNLNMTENPSDGSCQFLLLGEDTPPIVGVLHEDTTYNDDAQRHAVQLARRLTRSLTDVCAGKFVLIAVALPKNGFVCAALGRAVEEQRELMEGIYRRKLELEASEYMQLTEAVGTVQRMSPVPFFLHDSSCTLENIAVLEEDWFKLLSSYIEELTGTEDLAVTFNPNPETKFKEQAAVLEACRRIGCHASIWIDGSEANADFLSKIESFKAKAKKQLHQNLQIYCKGKYRNTAACTITMCPQKDASNLHTGMTGSSEKIHITLTRNGKETVDSSEKMGTSMGKRKTPDDSSEEFGRRRSNIKTLKLSPEEMDGTNGNKKSSHTKTSSDIMGRINGNRKTAKTSSTEVGRRRSNRKTAKTSSIEVGRRRSNRKTAKTSSTDVGKRRSSRKTTI